MGGIGETGGNSVRESRRGTTTGEGGSAGAEVAEPGREHTVAYLNEAWVNSCNFGAQKVIFFRKFCEWCRCLGKTPTRREQLFFLKKKIFLGYPGGVKVRILKFLAPKCQKIHKSLKDHY